MDDKKKAALSDEELDNVAGGAVIQWGENATAEESNASNEVLMANQSPLDGVGLGY